MNQDDTPETPQSIFEQANRYHDLRRQLVREALASLDEVAVLDGNADDGWEPDNTPSFAELAEDQFLDFLFDGGGDCTLRWYLDGRSGVSVYASVNIPALAVLDRAAWVARETQGTVGTAPSANAEGKVVVDLRSESSFD